MSSFLYDFLLPVLGADQAAYWASVLLIGPL